MPTLAHPPASALTAAQVATYHDQGFLVVENLLHDDEVARFLADQATEGGVCSGLQHHRVSPAWARLACHPAVIGRLTALLDAPVRIVQTMFLDKAPGGGKGIALHQDEHYLPVDRPTLTACWLALTDTDADNGGLCVVPGSHRHGVRQPGHNEDGEEHARWEQDHDFSAPDGRRWRDRIASFALPEVREEEVLRLTVPRGAGVFFTGRTIHGSYANRSPDRPRRSFPIHVVTEGTWLYRCDVQDPCKPADLRGLAGLD